MEKKPRNKTAIGGIFLILLAVSFFVVAFSAMLFSGGDKVQTEYAVYYKTKIRASFKGVFVRNEHEIFQNVSAGETVYRPLVDGTKLAIGTNIAYYYTTEQDARNAFKLEKLENRIDFLRSVDSEIEKKGVVQTISELDTLLFDNRINMAESIRSEDFSKIYSFKNEFLEISAKRAVASGKTLNFNYTISALEDEKSRIPNPSYRVVKSEELGFFAGTVDGYEDVLSINNINDISSEQILNITNRKANVRKNSVGKVIDDYKWQIAAVVDKSSFTLDNVFFFYQGRKFSSTIEGCEIPLIAEKVTDNGDGTALVVLSGEYFSGDFVSMRTAEITIDLQSPKNGIRIPTTAISFVKVDQEKEGSEEIEGVYILSGNKVTFRKIKKIANYGEFTLVYSYDDAVRIDMEEYNKNGNPKYSYDYKITLASGVKKKIDYLLPYESVLVSANGLKDGKTLKL